MTDDEKTKEEEVPVQDPLSPPPSARPEPSPQVTREKETIHEIRYMEPEKKSGKLKIIGVLVLILIVGVVAAFATMNVTIYGPLPDATYPYTTTYDVWFPLGKTVTVGGMDMVALSTADEMLISVAGETHKMEVGEEKLISERRAVVKTLGFTIVDTNFQIFMNFRGLSDPATANFHLAIRTSEQVPPVYREPPSSKGHPGDPRLTT